MTGTEYTVRPGPEMGECTYILGESTLVFSQGQDRDQGQLDFNSICQVRLRAEVDHGQCELTASDGRKVSLSSRTFDVDKRPASQSAQYVRFIDSLHELLSRHSQVRYFGSEPRLFRKGALIFASALACALLFGAVFWVSANPNSGIRLHRWLTLPLGLYGFFGIMVGASWMARGRARPYSPAMVPYSLLPAAPAASHLPSDHQQALPISYDTGSNEGGRISFVLDDEQLEQMDEQSGTSRAMALTQIRSVHLQAGRVGATCRLTDLDHKVMTISAAGREESPDFLSFMDELHMRLAVRSPAARYRGRNTFNLTRGVCLLAGAAVVVAAGLTTGIFGENFMARWWLFMVMVIPALGAVAMGVGLCLKGCCRKYSPRSVPGHYLPALSKEDMWGNPTKGGAGNGLPTSVHSVDLSPKGARTGSTGTLGEEERD